MQSRVVFPTYVGVFPVMFCLFGWSVGLPHVRGGVSKESWRLSEDAASSPRTWGCFLRRQHGNCGGGVFPTYVGVFPKKPPGLQNTFCLPHVRGGVSFFLGKLFARHLSSPRTWGCFPVKPPGAAMGEVFPTYVGVFLSLTLSRSFLLRLPHVRGGVSNIQLDEKLWE